METNELPHYSAPGPRGARGRRRILGAVFLLGLPLLFWFGVFANPALVPDTAEARAPVGFVHWDVYRLYFPSLHGYFDMLRGGELPLWDPYRAAGFPAMGSHMFGIFYPLNFPFLFLDVATGLTVTCVLHLLLALWGMVRCLRGLGLSRPAARLGAVVYAFSGYLVVALWHPSLFQALALTPLVFAVGNRWARKGGLDRAVLLGLVVGLQGLAGYVQGSIYTGYLLVPFLLWRAVSARGWRTLGTRVLPGGALAAILAAALCAVIVLPAHELSARSIRPPGGRTLVETEPVTPLGPTEYLSILVDPLNRTPGPRGDEAPAVSYYRSYAYVGVSILILLVLAPMLTRRGRRGLLIFFGVSLVLSALLAMGSNTPAFPFFHRYVPTGDAFRYPRRFLALAAFAAAVLAAHGADGIWRGAARRTGVTIAGLVGSSALVAGIAIWLTSRNLVTGASLGAALFLIAWSAAALFVLVRVRSPRVRALAVGCLLVGVVSDVFVRNRNEYLHPSADTEVFPRFQEGRAFLRENAGHDRVYLQRFGGRLRTWLPSKIGLIDGYCTCMDYEALTLERYERYTNLLSRGTADITLGFAGNRPIFLSESTYHHARLFDYLGVKYLAVESDTLRARELAAAPSKTGPGPLLRRVFDRGGMAIFENPWRVPRARFVPEYRVEGEPLDALRALLDPDLDPLRTVVLEAPPPSRPAKPPAVVTGALRGHAVRIVEYGAHRVEIEARCEREGFVVLTDQHYPGWHATVNGTPTPILPADYLYRAVPVPAGRHRVVFTFHPTSFHHGVLLAGGALLAAAILGFSARRRRRSVRSRASVTE